MVHTQHCKRGFTLIELSIVLVIIGLIVGGVLVGRDLISAAQVRGTVSQIEKFNQATNTFYGKYQYLPGDIPNSLAPQIGLITRGVFPGQGDGNGTIQGSTAAGNYSYGGAPVSGETAVFWRDLSTLSLIDAGLNTADFATNFYPQQTNPSYRLPRAKLGNGNYFYVYSGDQTGAYQGNVTGQTYFCLSAVSALTLSNWTFNSTPGLSVNQASSIDTKVDDGFPQSGRTQAFYVNHAFSSSYYSWAAGGGVEGANASHLPTTAATAGSSTTCYDNNNVAGTQKYSVTQNNGTGVNCALSVRFQ